MTAKPKPSLAVLALATTLLLILVLPAAAGARKTAVGPARHLTDKPARAEVGKARLAAPRNAAGAMLVSVHYPSEMIGRPVDLRVALHGLPGKGRRTWHLRVPADAGPQRTPERRRRFTFVHRIDIGPGLTKRLRAGLRPGTVSLEVTATAALDADGDGKPEKRWRDHETQKLRPAGRRLCADLPRLRTSPGKTVSTKLPVCGARVHWRIVDRPQGGVAKIRKGRLIYRPPAQGSGTEPIVLEAPAPSAPAAESPAAPNNEPGSSPGGKGKEEPASEAPEKAPEGGDESAEEEAGEEEEEGSEKGAGEEGGDVAASEAESLEAPAQVTVAPEEPVRVRAFGDSVTAGFGYYSSGELMPFYDLLECKPGEPYDDACSSNSTVTKNTVPKLEFAGDYGLKNNVSWAAQFANDNGVTDFKNVAVSGSEPKNWIEGGNLHSVLAELEAEKPDYVLLTIGANPILSDTLFGGEMIACGLITDIFGSFKECVEAAFDEVALGAYLEALYQELLEDLPAKTKIYVMQYHLSIPSISIGYTSTQIATMVKMLNKEIETWMEAAKAEMPNAERMQSFAPPHFNAGVDIEPTYPSNYGCYWFNPDGINNVDGPSVQSGPTQTLLAGLHPSFCSGPGHGEEPWVISGDTGIHPSATGYSHMESVLPAME